MDIQTCFVRRFLISCTFEKILKVPTFETLEDCLLTPAGTTYLVLLTIKIIHMYGHVYVYV